MKNKNYLIFLLSFSCFIGLNEMKAQCPEKGKPVLGTQAEIDSFLAIYPGCDYIEASYYAIEGVQVFWVKEEPLKYLAALSGILIGILGLLKFIFWKVPYFNN